MAALNIDLIALVMSGYLLGFKYGIFNGANINAVDSIGKSYQISRHNQSDQINVLS